MYYMMTYDSEEHDKRIEEGKNYIYAEESNLEDIKYPKVKKRFFHCIAWEQIKIKKWPEVKFYYSSLASDRESDYLLNIDNWPIIHKRVKGALEKEGIRGIRYLEVKLVDVVTGKANNNYYFMYIENFIDAFDMEKSEYIYDEEFDCYDFIPMKTYFNFENCKGYDIFRCSKSPVCIYVSEKFRSIIESNEFTGFLFRDYAY